MFFEVIIYAIVCAVGIWGIKMMVAFMYHFLCFNFIRIVAFLFTAFFGFIVIFYGEIHGSRQQKIIYIGLFLFTLFEFARQYYINNRAGIISFINFVLNILQTLINTVKFILKIGHKTGRFLVDVKTGVHSGKKQLEREREDFENEKLWFEEEKRQQKAEWEKIYKEWEKLIKEREEFERKSGRQTHNEKKAEYKESSKKEEKQEQGRYFSEFASFDLQDFNKNDPYKVLGCKRRDSADTIKKAYRMLLAKFHPDKFQGEGNLDKLKEAEQIAKLVNWAKGEI
jgi:DnaJ-domain-containing protein 1